MLGALLGILVILWVLGYVRIPGLVFPNFTLFVINGRAITLWNILIFLAILWALSMMPAAIRSVAAVILVLWLLSIFGVLVLSGLSSILVIAVIVAVALAMARA